MQSSQQDKKDQPAENRTNLLDNPDN